MQAQIGNKQVNLGWKATLALALMVVGEEDVDWWAYETDPDWWAMRLWDQRN